MATTSTPATSAGSASLVISGAGVNAGTAILPVYGMASDGTRQGAFLTAAPDFVGTWRLTRRTSGMQGQIPVQQLVCQGDQTLLIVSGAGPLATLTATDLLTLPVVGCVSGSMTLTVVQ